MFLQLAAPQISSISLAGLPSYWTAQRQLYNRQPTIEELKESWYDCLALVTVSCVLVCFQEYYKTFDTATTGSSNVKSTPVVPHEVPELVGHFLMCTHTLTCYALGTHAHMHTQTLTQTH